ncbi:MAG: hypothetical protein GY845_16495 [Planctomycetes bacterium]|nr:hypothetical protein [Planctomycetota bacterium]
MTNVDKNEKFKARFPWVIDLLMMTCTTLMMFAGLYSMKRPIVNKPKSDGLVTQIKEVEGAIKNLRNLETYLEKTKSDMIVTEVARNKIEEEYKRVKELEKLTENQLYAISLAVNKRTKADIIKSYFWGFIIGVSGSIIASYIYAYLLRKKRKINKSSDGEQ